MNTATNVADVANPANVINFHEPWKNAGYVPWKVKPKAIRTVYRNDAEWYIAEDEDGDFIMTANHLRGHSTVVISIYLGNHVAAQMMTSAERMAIIEEEANRGLILSRSPNIHSYVLTRGLGSELKAAYEAGTLTRDLLSRAFLLIGAAEAERYSHTMFVHKGLVPGVTFIG